MVSCPSGRDRPLRRSRHSTTIGAQSLYSCGFGFLTTGILHGLSEAGPPTANGVHRTIPEHELRSLLTSPGMSRGHRDCQSCCPRSELSKDLDNEHANGLVSLPRRVLL